MQEEKAVVICPNCGARYRVAARFAGRSVTCKRCGTSFPIDLLPHPERPSSDEGVADITDDAHFLLLGPLAIKFGMITQPQLDRAVQIQKNRQREGHPARLGEVLVDSGLIDAKQLEFLLSVQQLRELRNDDRRFGDMAVMNGFITSAQMEQALAKQKADFSQYRELTRLGDILVASGVLTREQREALLAAQQRLRLDEQPEADDSKLEEPVSDDQLALRRAHAALVASRDKYEAICARTEALQLDRSKIHEQLEAIYQRIEAQRGGSQPDSKLEQHADRLREKIRETERTISDRHTAQKALQNAVDQLHARVEENEELANRTAELLAEQERIRGELEATHQQIAEQRRKGKNTSILELRIDVLKHRISDVDRSLDRRSERQLQLSEQVNELNQQIATLEQALQSEKLDHFTAVAT